ncbi:MAG: helix-turn-helix transcriptional regulator [Microbacterium sp.]|uniref:helix-turn-helix domain-containing protein n=1 Tax=Microbacterium sp. TaxID=51671 RepID=UPI001AC93857|nr:helix-turn-helix transcriptional regulator [Microbacterium sp.]MBN9214797.1 helix-turn-helix transcriptional regulator [Microbacterium sp.]
MAGSSPHALDAAFGVSDRAMLGRVIAEARKQRGVSQRELEETSTVPQGKISRIERGVTYPTIREIDHLATALKLRVHMVVLDDTEV